jgi:cell division protease FtsH
LPDHNSNLPDLSPRRRRLGVIYGVLAAIFAGYLVYSMATSFTAKQVDTLATSDFVAAMHDDRVTDVTYHTSDGTLTGSYYRTDADRDNHAATEFKSAYAGVDNLDELMQSNGDVRFVVDTSDNSLWESVLLSVVPTLLLLVVFIYFMNQVQGQNGRAMQFGQTKAKTTEQTRPKVKFSDVAGIDEAVEELKEVRDFLREPERYLKMGAKIPRGVLLVGPPGTGKTLLAKAVAGEAGVPFFSISGSDFVEMFVGVGASRVRDLFKQAKEAAPAIIFIDEIDAVGRQRGAGLGGGHDEREQTLNQLLVEMDGFEDNSAVILIAATNRPDILDPALLRPGRFDRQVTVDRPDVKGRERILAVHSENKPIAPEVDLKRIAKLTPGFTGADLANLMNESALLAARRHKDRIGMDEVEEAMERVIAGPEKKGRVMTEKERVTIAYHESGHALVGHVLENSDPVHKISIISRGRALGYTMQLPEEDHFLETRDGMLDQIAVLLGGRTAEELFCADITTGASNDLERATKIAREMVTRFGMSEELGAQVFGEAQHEVFLGRDYANHNDYSAETAKRIDDEVERIMREAHDRARGVLEARRAQMDTMAHVLLERETVEGEVVNALLDDRWDEYVAAHPEEASVPAGAAAAEKDVAAEKDGAPEKDRAAEKDVPAAGEAPAPAEDGRPPRP